MESASHADHAYFRPKKERGSGYVLSSFACLPSSMTLSSCAFRLLGFRLLTNLQLFNVVLVHSTMSSKIVVSRLKASRPLHKSRWSVGPSKGRTKQTGQDEDNHLRLAPGTNFVCGPRWITSLEESMIILQNTGNASSPRPS
jgi:hypothetical protein